MRKLTFIFSILLFFLATFGQKDLITISGKIYDSRDSMMKMEALNTWLIINDTLIIESRPDSVGMYSFKISRNFLNSRKVQLVAFQDQNLLDKLYPTNDCPYLRRLARYFKHSKTIKSQPLDIKQIVLNLELSSVYIDMRGPCIGFKKNSIEFTNCYSDNSDTSLFCIRNILKAYPEYVIKISVHSWNENEIKNLSIKRGQYIIDKLHKLGADTNRVIIKIQEDHRPIISSAVIKKAPTKAEKEALDQKNRRATFQITSWEYETKKTN